MYAGQTARYNGYQYCLFPLDYMNCSQTSSPSSFSHCCGHPADWVGRTARYPYYAPCDCHRIQTLSAYGQTTYVSDNPVWTPSGLHYVTFTFAHDNSIPSQTSFSQGQLIGHTGTAGFVTGDHVHIDQSLFPDDYPVSYGVYCSGGNLCSAQAHSTYPDLVFYLGGTETIVNLQGMEFDTIPDHPGPGPETGGNLGAVMLLLIKKAIKRRSLNGRQKRI